MHSLCMWSKHERGSSVNDPDQSEDESRFILNPLCHESQAFGTLMRLTLPLIMPT